MKELRGQAGQRLECQPAACVAPGESCGCGSVSRSYASVSLPGLPPAWCDIACRIRGGQAVWAEATQGMQASTAASGARRADAGRRAAQARKMWQLLRSRLRGDVSVVPLLPAPAPVTRQPISRWPTTACNLPALLFRQPACPALPPLPAHLNTQPLLHAYTCDTCRSCCLRCGVPRCRWCE